VQFGGEVGVLLITDFKHPCHEAQPQWGVELPCDVICLPYGESQTQPLQIHSFFGSPTLRVIRPEAVFTDNLLVISS
jgi:hypothetical protein